MSVAALLVNTCTITPRVEAKSATTGGVTYTADTGARQTLVPCNVQAVSGFETVMAGRETGRRSFRVYFAAGTSIPLNAYLDTFAGSSIGALSGKTLEVTSPPVDPVGRGTYLMVTAEETAGDGT